MQEGLDARGSCCTRVLMQEGLDLYLDVILDMHRLSCNCFVAVAITCHSFN